MNTPQHLPRTLQDSGNFGCTPPQPLQFPVWNITTNTTTYIEIPQEVHNVLVEFDYEIRHWSNVNWVSGSDGSESEEEDGGWFSKLFDKFGGSDETEEVQTAANSTANILQDLETTMVTSIWDEVLKDGNMTWDEKECAGLVISDDDETMTNDDANAEFVAPKFETKLLGLSVYPADEVNPDGEWFSC